jgi:hypothetical protein
LDAAEDLCVVGYLKAASAAAPVVALVNFDRLPHAGTQSAVSGRFNRKWRVRFTKEGTAAFLELLD